MTVWKPETSREVDKVGFGGVSSKRQPSNTALTYSCYAAYVIHCYYLSTMFYYGSCQMYKNREIIMNP